MSIPESIKPIIRTIYSKYWSSCICFGSASVSFHYDYFGPDFIINIIPLIQYLDKMILSIIRVISYRYLI